MNDIDPKRFGKVAVLLGGVSAERQVSLNSGRLVLAALQRMGIDAHPFDPSEQSVFALKEQGFARAFNALHGGYGENGTLQGALDFLGIRYTGTGVLGSALGMDKFRAKLIWQQCGIPTPPFEVVMSGTDYAQRAAEILETLGLPLFVKPSREGSSIAITKVKVRNELAPALAAAAAYDDVILVEKSIEGGGEYTIAMAGKLELPIIHIIPPGEFYDYDAKYLSDKTQYLIPCGLDNAAQAHAQTVARRAFAALGCSDWGRADFMVDAQGQPYFLEINTAPGMTDHSLPPKAARAVGISYEELVLEILALTLKDPQGIRAAGA